jgi:hypothetical protein
MTDAATIHGGIGRLVPGQAAGRVLYGAAAQPGSERPPTPSAPEPESPAPEPPEPGPLQGDIAHCDHAGVAGWAMDAQHPGARVRLEVLADGAVVARGVADQLRPDLEIAGLGDGHCGFAIRFAPRLPPDRARVLELRRSTDGAAMPGSPLLLAAVTVDMPALVADVTRAVATAASIAGRDALAATLARGISALVQARVESRERTVDPPCADFQNPR